MKKSLSIFLIVVMLMSLTMFTAIPAYADEGTLAPSEQITIASPPEDSCGNDCNCCRCQTKSTCGSCNDPCGQPTWQPCVKPIVITKHPWSETKLVDGQSSTYFEAHATNYVWMSWEFKIGDYGTPFSAEDAANQYGVNLEGFNSNQLWIRNISWGINGWYVRAVFYDCNGCPTYSNWAFIQLVEYVEPSYCVPPHPHCHYDPYLTMAPVVPAVPVYPVYDLSYSHTELETVSLEATLYPGYFYSGLC